jgi:hypothetical protein
MMGTLTVFLALVSFVFVATQSIPKVRCTETRASAPLALIA